MNKQKELLEATYIFNMGYMAGHHDTVESQYTIIRYEDLHEYHSDVVKELIEDLRLGDDEYE